MIYDTFPDLITAYLEEHMKGKASQANIMEVARQSISTLTTTPTRRQVLERHALKGHGDFQKRATQANSELAILRAACRWGMYQERWEGGDPTAGIKKWNTPKRKRISKFDELSRLLVYFEHASEEMGIRDRALYGLMLFTGCRPGEARTALLTSRLTATWGLGSRARPKRVRHKNSRCRRSSCRGLRRGRRSGPPVRAPTSFPVRS